MTEEAASEQEGGGIRISAGTGFRISNLSLTVDPETGELKGSDIRAEVRTDVFHHWLRISEDEADRARLARQTAELTADQESEEFDAALNEEFRAALVAVAAAAFAIDAFYASTTNQAPEARVACDTRDATIFESLKRGFALTGRQQKGLRKPLRNLFRARDEAVHPTAKWVDPILHPTFKVGMDPKLVAYRAEVAQEAATLARQIIWTCLQNPKSTFADLARWADELAPMVDEPRLPDGWVS